MSESTERSIELEFRCRSCGLAGLTPEVTRQEALHLVRAELEIRCPRCGAILAIRTSGLTSELEFLASRATTFADAVREELEQVLTQELFKGRDDD